MVRQFDATSCEEAAVGRTVSLRACRRREWVGCGRMRRFRWRLVGGWPAGRSAAGRSAGSPLAIRAIVVAALPRCTVTLAAPPGLRGPFCALAPFPPFPQVYVRTGPPVPYPASPHGTRKRAPEASTAQRANLERAPSRASSRRASPHLARRLLPASPRLACSRPRRERLVYIARARARALWLSF